MNVDPTTKPSCLTPNCDNPKHSRGKGYCKKHGAEMFPCASEGCKGTLPASMSEELGALECDTCMKRRHQAARGRCSVEKCHRNVRHSIDGLCHKHYKIQREENAPECIEDGCSRKCDSPTGRCRPCEDHTREGLPLPIGPLDTRMCALYVAYDWTGRPIYVGETVNPKGRFSAHRTDEGHGHLWGKFVEVYEVVFWDKKHKILELEKEGIEYFNSEDVPLFNRKCNELYTEEAAQALLIRTVNSYIDAHNKGAHEGEYLELAYQLLAEANEQA